MNNTVYLTISVITNDEGATVSGIYAPFCADKQSVLSLLTSAQKLVVAAIEQDTESQSNVRKIDRKKVKSK